MNEHINLDDSVLAPKRPLSMEPADTEGHRLAPRVAPNADDTEGHRLAPRVAPNADDAEGHIRSPWADGTDVRTPDADDTEGHRRI